MVIYCDHSVACADVRLSVGNEVDQLKVTPRKRSGVEVKSVLLHSKRTASDSKTASVRRLATVAPTIGL